MAEPLARAVENGMGAWSGLGRTQQALLLAAGLLLPAAAYFGTSWLGDGQYVPLFASLSAEEAGGIVAQLKASKTPYRLGAQGEQILVPADKAGEIRLRVATQGLPIGGGVGFELFDKPAFGISDFTQRLNYQRGLQGELARTIAQIREVNRVRVHLALPQPSLFAERSRPPSASVFVKLVPGAHLSREQVRGVVHLVASSVEGLNPERVTVVDTAGRVLAVGADPQEGQLSPRRLELKAAVEEGLERRVQSLLDSALGPGRAVTRVSAQVSLEQAERTEERFDPTPVLRQRTRTVDTSRGSSAAPVPGVTGPVPANAPAAPPPPASTTSNEGSRESESVTYEVSRVVARTQTAPGEVRRLSVAVVLDTNAKVTRAPDGKETREPVPRAPEELEKLRRLVMGAVGYTQSRGDEVTVVEVPFDTSALDRERTLLEQPAPPPAGLASRPSLPVHVVAPAAAVVALAIVCLVWLLRRRYRRQAFEAVALSLGRPEAGDVLSATDAATAAPAASVPSSPVPLVTDAMLQVSREREDIRQKALAMARTEPDATAQLLRVWLVNKRAGRDAG